MHQHFPVEVKRRERQFDPDRITRRPVSVRRLRNDYVNLLRIGEIANVMGGTEAVSERRHAPAHHNYRLAEKFADVAGEVILQFHRGTLEKSGVIPFARFRERKAGRLRPIGYGRGELRIVIAGDVDTNDSLRQSAFLQFEHKLRKHLLHFCAPDARMIRHPRPIGARFFARSFKHVHPISIYDIAVLCAPDFVCPSITPSDGRIHAQSDGIQRIRSRQHGATHFFNRLCRVEAIGGPRSLTNVALSKAHERHHQRYPRFMHAFAAEHEAAAGVILALEEYRRNLLAVQGQSRISVFDDNLRRMLEITGQFGLKQFRINHIGGKIASLRIPPDGRIGFHNLRNRIDAPVPPT